MPSRPRTNSIRLLMNTPRARNCAHNFRGKTPLIITHTPHTNHQRLRAGPTTQRNIAAHKRRHKACAHRTLHCTHMYSLIFTSTLREHRARAARTTTFNHIICCEKMPCQSAASWTPSKRAESARKHVIDLHSSRGALVQGEWRHVISSVCVQCVCACNYRLVVVICCAYLKYTHVHHVQCTIAFVCAGVCVSVCVCVPGPAPPSVHLSHTQADRFGALRLPLNGWNERTNDD